MTIDLSMLYHPADATDALLECKLCLAIDGHTEDCPGKLLESCTFMMVYAGDSCPKGCCGDSHGEVFSTTRSGLLKAVAASVHDLYHVCCTAYRVVAEPVTEEELQAAIMARREEAHEELSRRAAEVAARDAERERKKALALLEAERSDLLPEAYVRRLAALTTT